MNGSDDARRYAREGRSRSGKVHVRTTVIGRSGKRSRWSVRGRSGGGFKIRRTATYGCATSVARLTTSLVEIGAVVRELGTAPSSLPTRERRYQMVVPDRGDHGGVCTTLSRSLRSAVSLLRFSAGHARTAHDGVAGTRPLRTARIRLAPSPAAPQLARRAGDSLLEEYGNARFAFGLRLVASELVAEAWAIDTGHLGTNVTVRLPVSSDAACRVEGCLDDSSPGHVGRVCRTVRNVVGVRRRRL